MYLKTCVYMLYSHEQLYVQICRRMQNHNDDTIKTSDTILKKNIPLTLFERLRKDYERFYCVRGELKAEENCNILTRTLMAITAFLSRSPGLFNWGPSLPGTCSSFQHLLSNWLNFNCSIRGLRAPSAGCWFCLTQLISSWSDLQLIELPVYRVI